MIRKGLHASAEKTMQQTDGNFITKEKILDGINENNMY